MPSTTQTGPIPGPVHLDHCYFSTHAHGRATPSAQVDFCERVLGSSKSAVLEMRLADFLKLVVERCSIDPKRELCIVYARAVRLLGDRTVGGFIQECNSSDGPRLWQISEFGRKTFAFTVATLAIAGIETITDQAAPLASFLEYCPAIFGMDYREAIRKMEDRLSAAVAADEIRESGARTEQVASCGMTPEARAATKDMRLAQIAALGCGVYVFPARHFPETLADFLSAHSELRLVSHSPGEQAAQGLISNFVVTTEIRAAISEAQSVPSPSPIE